MKPLAKNAKKELAPSMEPRPDRLSEKNLRHIVIRLSSFATRNTNTEQCDEAVSLAKEWLDQIPGIETEVFQYHLPVGKRVPEEKTAVQLTASLPGEDDHRILAAAHIDSLNRLGSPYSDLAPGANDNLSGVSIVLECARLMAIQNWRHTIHFVLFTGEEQGLLGASALAEFARSQDWKVMGLINIDTVGARTDSSGTRLPGWVRVFSEDSPAHSSRELARYLEWLNATRSKKESVRFDPSLVRRRPEESERFQVQMILRQDRVGRGGDHMPFNRQGFTAVRLVEASEDFERQHTVDDTAAHVDFDRVYKTANICLHALTALANAEPDPVNVRIDRELSTTTTLRWEGDASQQFLVYQRPTILPVWESCIPVRGLECALKNTSKDDCFFAVGSVGGIPVPAV